ncbi:hypothetical protein NV379_14905 [Paenibacillus sp. N1-5-1-14]|uniref:hypothetical protein n=1 Tax=Paenibacillus radicibacter TaxID=2972488 RepID=UPI00215979EC|nr:hypothetical protein [Paenibacillus radicibacter]MCR8643942.1 hypothetical protein [Paenibacillus radicibacter]
MNLDQKYKESKLPFNHSLKEVDQFLKEKYSAIELSKDYFKYIINDPYVNFNNVIKCYKIDDATILDELFNDREKEMHVVVSNFFNEEGIINLDDNALLNKNIQVGNLLHIILESDNGEKITSFTLQGECRKVRNQLIILKGVIPEDCIPGNVDYDMYLQSLWEEGYLN